MQRDQAELENRLEERHEAADLLVQQATREVQHRMHVQVEEARMRHEQHVARVAMANRALEFRRQQLLDRDARDRSNKVQYGGLLDKAHRLSQTHWDDMTKKNDAFTQLVDVYKSNGCFKKDLLRDNPMVPALGGLYIYLA